MSGSPKYSDTSQVEISENTILPLGSSENNYIGTTRVNYFGVANFILTHGNGNSCNPGYIILSKINFKKTKSSSNSLNILNHKLDLFFNESILKQVTIYNSLGQVVKADFNYYNGWFSLDVNNLSNAVYFLNIEFENAPNFNNKIIVYN